MPTVGLPMMPWEVSAATGIGHCNSFPPVCFGAWQRARENGCKGFRTTSGASSALHDRLGPGRASLLRCFHSRHRTASLHFGFDQAHLPPRRCSRQCPHIHALHAGFAQYARAFAQGGAGGHHVIEQGDMRGQRCAGFDLRRRCAGCVDVRAHQGRSGPGCCGSCAMRGDATADARHAPAAWPVPKPGCSRARAGGFHAGARTARQPVAAAVQSAGGIHHQAEPAIDRPRGHAGT
jgi:hypothetical protein